MTTWDEALHFRADATAALTAAGVDAVVTMDGPEATANLLAGADVLLLGMPTTERTGTALEVQTWTAYAICGQPDDVTEWWPRLDKMTAALNEPLQVESSAHVVWMTLQGNEFPATQYTFTT